MRTVTTSPTAATALIASLCALCIACEASRATHRPTFASPLMASDTTLLKSVAFEFQVRIPRSMRVDSSVQYVVEKKSFSPLTHSWGFVKDPAQGDTNPHWQRIMINAVHGVGIGKESWSAQAARTLKRMRGMARHDAEIVENDVQWQPGSAEYRVGIHDMVRGEFTNARCLGSQVGGQRSTIVCVETVALTAEALAPVRESLMLAPQQGARPAR